MLAMEGATPPYAIPDMIVEHVPTTIALPTARLRGNAHGYTAFFTESFVDELAHRSGREALSYRVAMLGHEPRLVRLPAALRDFGQLGRGRRCQRAGAGLPHHR